MGWKNWSYTLRGFYIGLIIFGIGFLSLMFGFKFFYHCFTDGGGYCNLLLFSIILSMFSPIIAPLIGWLISKIKSKKENRLT